MIAGYAGIGKTTLGKKYNNVIDLESSPFKYEYSKDDTSPMENRKGRKDRTLRKDWPQNYWEAIEDAILKYDFVLVQGHHRHFDFLDKNEIEFWVVYPNKEALELYRKRYTERGNNQDYIDKVINGFDKMRIEFEKNKSKKIILKGKETLEDYLLDNGYELC